MARGRLFSRKYEPANPRPPEELETSKNPLVQLGLAFKKLQKLAPETLPNPSGAAQESVPRRPLVDINDVRKYLREKLAITKEVSTIPIPNPALSTHAGVPLPSSDTYESSETTHMSSTHSYSSNASSLPQHDAATGARVFDIGTVGHPILEVSEPQRTASSSSEVRPSSAGQEQASTSYTWILEPPDSETSRAQLDMKDVQEFVRGVVEVVRRIENWGLPESSWENKMPWHSPPPKIFARGLQRPPESFSSEEERLAFNRLARKQKKFLTGCPPTWSFMVANFALLGFLVYNPLGR